MRKDIGPVSAYAIAVACGYTGTEEEFGEFLASAAEKAGQAVENANKAEAYAKGTVDDTPVSSGEPGYHDNSLYYKEQAGDSASESRKWADGKDASGQDVPSTAPQHNNNSKFYSEQAQHAVATSGYVAFEIDDDGYLVYTRNANTDVDFAIDSDGYLVMESGDANE